MFTGVLLHQVEPALPVNGTLYGFPNSQGCVAQMYNGLAPFLHIQHVASAQCTQVAGLTATFRVKGRGIQYHFPAFFSYFAGDHLGTKCAQVAILIK